MSAKHKMHLLLDAETRHIMYRIVISKALY